MLDQANVCERQGRWAMLAFQVLDLKPCRKNARAEFGIVGCRNPSEPHPRLKESQPVHKNVASQVAKARRVDSLRR